jgi:hypothetical protein
MWLLSKRFRLEEMLQESEAYCVRALAQLHLKLRDVVHWIVELILAASNVLAWECLMPPDPQPIDLVRTDQTTVVPTDRNAPDLDS